MMLQAGKLLMVITTVGMIVVLKVENALLVVTMVTVVQRVKDLITETVLWKCHKQYWNLHGEMKHITCVLLKH